MEGKQNIRFLSNEQIDKERWDQCIAQSSLPLIYAGSFYLDKMADNWDGLVLNDYEAVMPLTWRKKYGLYYLYQPFLTAQLGVFGKTVDATLLEDFLLAIPEKFRYIDIYLNQENVFPLKEFKLYQRANYVLDLRPPYASLYKNYRENIQRNIRKAEQAGCKLEKGFSIAKVIELALQQMKNRSAEITENVKRFTALYEQLEKQQQAMTYGIRLQDQLVATAAFFITKSRAYYILVGNHPNGKTIGASHMLIDAFIKDHAGKELILDFEGSDIQSLAFFYSSFGAVEEKYAALKFNRLPWYLKWMKN